MTLDDLIALHQESLFLPDPAALELVLATWVASKLSGHPFWLLLVGPPASGKTVLIDELQGLDQVVFASTMTEASLLSQKKGKNGPMLYGILPTLGRHGGLLCAKDVTSLLSAESQTKRKVFAALREIHDGTFIRHLASNGGVPCLWQGRIGVLGAVTDVIEAELTDLRSMGERFFYYRLPTNDHDQRLALGAKALENAPRRDEITARLKGATTQFLGDLTIDADAEPFSEEANRSLMVLCDLVTRARSSVSTNYRGEVDIIPEAEEVPRMMGGLDTLARSLLILGCDEDEIWRLVIEVAMGSIPKARRAVLDLLALNREVLWSSEEMAAELRIGTDTAARVLAELDALGIIEAFSDSPRRFQPSEWLLTRWFEIRVDRYVPVRQVRTR